MTDTLLPQGAHMVVARQIQMGLGSQCVTPAVSHTGACLKGPSTEFKAVILRFLINFEQGALHFHFALGPCKLYS